MTYANQFEYDNAAEPELSDYRESPMFAEFVEYVALALLAGRDCMGIDSQIFIVDLKLATGGYMLALERVSERVTERQYRAWIDDCGYELN